MFVFEVGCGGLFRARVCKVVFLPRKKSTSDFPNTT
jgi:hypothetical protein